MGDWLEIVTNNFPELFNRELGIALDELDQQELKWDTFGAAVHELEE